jgi:hypothetical protein
MPTKLVAHLIVLVAPKMVFDEELQIVSESQLRHYDELDGWMISKSRPSQQYKIFDPFESMVIFLVLEVKKYKLKLAP